jgi:hypothetical protein
VYRSSGACHCGSLLAEVALVRPPAAYRPRICDCDFCRKHGIAYLSDAAGALLIRVPAERDLIRYRQGLGLAEFLLCRGCGVPMGAALRAQGGELFGVCNARILDGWHEFGPEQRVSPQSLSAHERVARWQSLWFRQPRIEVGGC